ncbi:hypothetical protein G7B40_027795 [Aetokthonos hydrillicola Thurmond2011]|jgi:hypothetical protein|uniref:PEP-CTERM sorting domain-containing protein n=1 Tax=Aetokthonos hydrillicola Thurmond2011 TaxID=2712845 RepID=A0AAP5IBX1_9CYAN|nr:hypothetical protein [Aetokthonos hydrillicola]MBO3459173.1 hypothetical protein [Aetokthonos hydrillicola CCALA 1050]MBW4584132.1 hypothetical protein [Aetokthonos hydrillicola CCALA 1050]MDR9898334.1 hypothetical protein [Aetokthonos hydrillicola Thurmond2011]
MINWQVGLMLRVAVLVSSLPIALSTVLAKDAKAVDSTDTNRTVVVLFSGFGEVTFTGLNTVNQDLQAQLGTNPDKPFSSQVFPDYALDEASNYVKSFNDIKNLVVIGDGLGGSSAYDLAKTVQPAPVNLLVEANAIGRPSLDQAVNINQFEQILQGGGFTDVEQKANDIFQNRQSINFRESEIQFLSLAQSQNFQNVSLLGALNVIKQFFPVVDLSTPPVNVNQGINYFYTSAPTEVQGIKNIKGFTNIDVNQLLGDPNLSNITSIKVVQDGIGTAVKDVVDQRKSVPEAPSILGNLIGAISAGLLIMKHKQKRLASRKTAPVCRSINVASS